MVGGTVSSLKFWVSLVYKIKNTLMPIGDTKPWESSRRFKFSLAQKLRF